jgi:hypothetical protein
MSQEFLFTKRDVSCYRFTEKSGLWANIYLDLSSETSGRLIIASDYGSWQYYWPSTGRIFKQFLIDLSKDLPYMMGKLERADFYDHSKFIHALMNKLGNIRIQRKSLIREIEDLQHETPRTSNEAYLMLTAERYPEILDLMNGEYDMISDANGHSQQLQRFIAEVWPVFTAELQKEL